MLILDLWGISFHAVVVFALGKNLLFKFALGHCGVFYQQLQKIIPTLSVKNEQWKWMVFPEMDNI